MSEKTTLSGELVLSVPLADVIAELSSQDRARILTLTGFDRQFLKDVVSQLAEGVAGEDRDYWFDHRFYDELREALVEQMPAISRELVRGLIQERDKARSDERRMNDWAWSMYHAWPMDGYLRPEMHEWTYISRISEEQADAMIAAREVTK